MTGAAGPVGASAAAAAAIVQAIKASGVLVRVEPAEFERLLARTHAPLVVTAEGGFFTTKYRYLTSYKGLGFYTQSTARLALPANAELVTADRIWMPG